MQVKHTPSFSLYHQRQTGQGHDAGSDIPEPCPPLYLGKKDYCFGLNCEYFLRQVIRMKQRGKSAKYTSIKYEEENATSESFKHQSYF